MRHCNRLVHSGYRSQWEHGVKHMSNGKWMRTVPYCMQYIKAYKNSSFKTATSKNRYVQILQYVADHDGCKRVDIIRDVFGYKNVNAKDPWYKGMRACRGYWSNGFSQLLYIDVIDYDKNFCYHITDRGREVLKTAYVNDCVKIVKSK